jgi:hypothetical protein
MKIPHTITLKQKFAVGNRLHEVLTERPDGLWEYANGFDDEVIANEFNIPKRLVTSVRRRTFGKIVLALSRKDNSDLELRVHILEKWAASLDPNWNKLKL